MANFERKEHQNNNEKPNELRFLFGDIRPSVREVGLGWNTYSILEKRYRESQQISIEKIEKSSSESDISYTTATSINDESYSTANEDFVFLRRPSEDIKSETSIDSIDRSRYKKNALITRLLQSPESNFSNNNQVFIDSSTNECDAPNLFKDKHNDKRNKKIYSEKRWDNNTSEETMYADRVFRLFQSKEDEDVYVHPLREQIKEDPVWQEFRLARKGIEITETARHYYLNLPDEKFGIFEKIESNKKSKIKRKVKTTGFTLRK